MAVTSYKYAGTAVNVDRDGKAAWSEPDCARTDDTNYATLNTIKNTYSDWLLLTNFGFTSTDIPSGSTINGIEFIICKSVDVTGAAVDNALYLYDDGQVGSNLASASAWSVGSPVEVTYGGSTNMCGTSLTQADIVASTFGIRFSVSSPSAGYVASVDYIKIRVYYTEGGGSTVFLPNIMKHHFIPPLIGGY